MLSIEQTRQILRNDLDPDFIESVSKGLGWAYADLYGQLASDRSLIDGCREEAFNKQRGLCAMQALSRAAQQHRIPFEYRRLDYNGQHKLLVKAGRVIVIQEPILSIEDRPKVADYKVKLAEIHGYVSQLELDLGDQPTRIRDWSGCVLAVLLHGPAGERFTKAHKMLGSVMLGVPDASYQQWIIRLDLHAIAMFGRGEPEAEVFEVAEVAVQSDNVVVTPKKKSLEKDTA